MDETTHLEYTFNILAADPHSWLEQANGLRMSAALIRVEMERVLPLPQTVPRVREQQLAFVQTFMLLTGFSFELVIKAVLIAQNRVLAARGEAHTLWRNARGGHGIVALAGQTGAMLSAEETDLLERLEEYLVWAGRYPLPRRVKDYIDSATPNNRRRYRSTDPRQIDELFARFAGMCG